MNYSQIANKLSGENSAYKLEKQQFNQKYGGRKYYKSNS